MKKFVLIDGNAILHRAYHALPPLTNKKGEVANAVYGFSSMLLKVLSDLKPDYLAVAFDRAAPNFRQQLYAGYQAQRPKTADDFVPQIAMVHDVLEKMGIAVFELDGYEADDIIGTLARQAVKGKLEVGIIIVSGDRDMLQLVNSRVSVYAPIIGLTKTVLFDEQKVEKKYGLKPEQVIDYKALVGDASDNYPGVMGIGPKTASELLKRYKTFENLYQHLGDVPPKIAERLAVDAEQAALAKKLATIAVDCPISLDIEKCSLLYFDMHAAQGAFEELGFKSLIKRLEGSKVEKVEAVKKVEKGKDEQLGLL